MQNKLVTTSAGLTNLFVQASFFPTRKHLWFALSKIATHREIGVRQVQCRLVLAFHFIVHNSHFLLGPASLMSGPIFN